MKVTCKVCNTSKILKEEKLDPYRGKVISTKCANKECTNRIKFKVPLLKENKQDIKEDTKTTEVDNKKVSKPIEPTPKKETIQRENKDKQVVCPNCKVVIVEETNFCMECGHKIVKPSIITKPEPNPKPKSVPKPKLVPKPKPEPVSKPNKKKCTNCGSENEVDEKFCPKCGTPMAEQSNQELPKVSKNDKKQIKQTPENKLEEISKKTPEVSPKKVSEKIPIQKSTSKKNKITKPVQQVVPKRKKKGGCLSFLWKAVVAIIVIASIAVVAFVVLDDSNEYKLANGPWEVEEMLSEKLYTRNKGKTAGLKEAYAKANAEYATTFNMTTIDAPILGNYKPSEEDFLFDQYNPNKKGDFYLCTIKDPSMNGGELRVIIHLKSDDYFEGKGFFMSKDEVSIGYLRGILKK